MRFEFQVLFMLITIGLLTRKLSWRGWFFVALFVLSWMMFDWIKG